MLKALKNILLFLVYSVFKNYNKASFFLKSEIERITNNYDIHISAFSVQFVDYNIIEIVDINIKLKGFYIGVRKIIIKINVKDLLLKWSFSKSIAVKINNLEISQSVRNTEKKYENQKIEINERFEQRYYSLFKKISGIFFKMPYSFEVNGVKCSGIFPFFKDASVKIFKNKLEFNFCLRETNSEFIEYIYYGIIDRNNRSIVLSKENDLNFNDKLKPGQHFSFDNSCFSYFEKTFNTGTLINIEIEINRLLLKYRGVSEHEILLKNVSLNLQFDFSSEKLALTENSRGIINSIPFEFELIHDVKEQNLIKATVYIKAEPKLFFESFPKFNNEDLRKIDCSGSISIQCTLMFMLNNPLNHSFEIEFDKGDFHISNIESFDLSFLVQNNGDLGSKLLKKVNRVSEKNIPLDEIPLNLINILVYIEDPNFYIHKGVDVYFIGRAIVSNIVKKQFFRGGSTITMQLIRNLFLNHHKNLFRKIEEIIIALLIENYFEIPKRRILEIYLNVIEFGPSIFGIKKACDFYFGKSPKDLTILECIVISYIIPRPIFFYEALLIKSDQLRINLSNYIFSVSKRLTKNGIISSDEQKKIGNEIKFSSSLGKIIINK